MSRVFIYRAIDWTQCPVHTCCRRREGPPDVRRLVQAIGEAHCDLVVTPHGDGHSMSLVELRG